ncbi:MAG: GNAT family N-acetyltransferase [Chloroflexota bacterium]
MINNEVIIRPVEERDRDAIIYVEGQAMPNWRYVERVFDQFMGHDKGEFSLAELDGQVVACAKFTVLPDGSAWVETLRVDSDYQGRGIGKALYNRFFEVAKAQNVSTMRMYTGMQNKVSRGLAEHFGFNLDASFYGATYDLADDHFADLANFELVSDEKQATDLLMPLGEMWNNFMVMNRTFYKITPELCQYLVQHGRVYADQASDSVIAFGARFMPDVSQHIGMYGGDSAACLNFAKAKGKAVGAQSLSCLFPVKATQIRDDVQSAGFKEFPAGFIVMKSG